MVFPVVTYGCESWTIKKTEHQRIDAFSVVLENTLESPLVCKEIKLVNPEGNQSWLFVGRTDVEAETPILWPPDVKNWLIWKDPDARKDWRREEKGMTEDEMVGWHHWLNWHEVEQTPGVGDGQGSLACCSPWGYKESDTTEWLNWTDEKSLLVGKYPDAGKDWGQENGATEDEMIGWYHQLNGHEFEQTPGDNEGQKSLECCSPWDQVTKSWTRLSDWTTKIDYGRRDVMADYVIFLWCLS